MKHGVMIQYFEWYLPDDASLWRQLKKNAQALADKGITSVWMPPAYKGAGGIHDVGYGVYDMYDLGEFDQKGSIPTKYGTKQEYLQAIKALQEAGINAYADIVFNHRMGADRAQKVEAVETASDDRTQTISDVHTIEAWTEFDFEGRHNKYSDFKWRYPHFNGVDYDSLSQRHGIFNFDHSPWQKCVDNENGNYDYLMGADVNFDNTEVIDELTRWGQWYVDITHVDGFRLDALKHIDARFFPSWLYTLRTTKKKEFFAVGEYWNSDVQVLEDYLETADFSMSLFDVPLHFNLYHISKKEMNLNEVFNNTLVQKQDRYAVTFVDNHDSQKGQALESEIEDWFTESAYALILLRSEGYPCVFYRDYYGSHHEQLDQMMELRKTRIDGTRHDYFEENDCVGWSYENNGCAVIISTGSEKEKEMLVGQDHAGQTWIDALSHSEQEITINEEGMAHFPCSAQSVSIWIPKQVD